jgi:hypothetical protein
MHQSTWCNTPQDVLLPTYGSPSKELQANNERAPYAGSGATEPEHPARALRQHQRTKLQDCAHFGKLHDFHKDTRDVITTDVIAPTFPTKKKSDFKNHCFLCLSYFNF